MQNLLVVLGLYGIMTLAGCSQNSADTIKSSFAISDQAPVTKKSQDSSIVIPEKEELQADNGKASDDDEGIPGYLVDPSQIDADTDGDGTLFTAPNNTIMSKSQKPIFVVAWELDEDFIDSKNGILDDGAAATAVRLASSPVVAGGSFQLFVPEEQRGNGIVVSISYEAEPVALEFVIEERNTYAAFAFAKKSSGGGGHGGGFPQQQQDEVFGLVASDAGKLDKFELDFDIDFLDQLFDQEENSGNSSR
ncbi:hypothetical protein [Pseudobacteriovorax antillogorgiicola]|uniref:Uncharacterized protein n=1 Tax=Pseudobacteriovorax antillogorgiicola TaxID=1513793 RepID=A0A1Y6CJH4_9BACT|nr:hypothetical protein [Pseudobacteriovorax antillogorgiicola]TCS46395.1 hypothetical protein EDD56_12459 [Pseudobacteriovorax antillogorgiicola]SMF68738.1 hypothetical protein SAMN06296036_12459 [Pseudobacteriovorax antillogorgiicola]